MARLLLSATVIATLVSAHAAQPLREDRVAAVLAHYSTSPVALRVLLQPMPKGGDLHNHLDGSVYAEDYLQWASDDGDCIARADRTITPPPCAPGQVPATELVTRDPKFYQETIDALSMRNFVPGIGTGETNGHDHAFATFRRFGRVAATHLGDMLMVTRQQAWRNNVAYIEQISDPQVAFAPELFAANASTDPATFQAQSDALAPLLPKLVANARAEYDAAENMMVTRLSCQLPDAPDPACAVRVHYLYFVLRTLPPRQVFAQMALGFALCAADPRFVGVNLVAPEDDPVALRDFELQMRMFQFFHARYPKVKLSLHAGELSLGLVPPSELGSHIRDTVEIAGASRVGHGYELPYERDVAGLLKEMAAKTIAVEINLTSNAITPGIVGAEHPLALYRAAHVPVTLSADDEGVFRIDLTHEYVRAVTEQHLDYHALKQIARNGLEYSFLPGQSLWTNGDYAKPVAACAHDTLGGSYPSQACAAFLRTSEKAQMQWAFERDIADYETAVLAGRFTPR